MIMGLRHQRDLRRACHQTDVSQTRADGCKPPNLDIHDGATGNIVVLEVTHDAAQVFSVECRVVLIQQDHQGVVRDALGKLRMLGDVDARLLMLMSRASLAARG